MYDQEREIVRETVAFGRRSEGPPGLYYPREVSAKEATIPGNPKCYTNLSLKLGKILLSGIRVFHFEFSRNLKKDNYGTKILQTYLYLYVFSGF